MIKQVIECDVCGHIGEEEGDFLFNIRTACDSFPESLDDIADHLCKDCYKKLQRILENFKKEG